MKLLSCPLAVVAAVCCSFSRSIEAHSWLVKPVSRDTGPRTTDGTIGCPKTNAGTPTPFSPGEEIDVRYWRNNHLGGFIRWSLSPDGSETASNFDDNVFFYTCRESGPDCVPADGSTSRYAGDSSGDHTISCGDTITLPDWLDEGDYVLQWVWFGVGSSYGNVGWAEPQFVSCADITLTSAGSSSEPECPTFVGGDRVTKNENLGNDECFYFYTSSIESTQYKGSNEDYEQNYVFGKPSYVENCSGTRANSGNATMSPVTQSPVTTSPSSTAESPTATPTSTEYPPESTFDESSRGGCE
ncbi:putative lytic polysaccharide monooxygenase 9 [Phytophthora infestans]|uniref:Putative lytic polysaccharide monooxygenase 9 n=1 Tax=Phytophthora infestans TaxID=4787 RepID=A0A833T5M1_PHYIN|nr:putative lytic polysaccharide monooxygenase 9 [Phytophthora infestans]KAF4140369.1 putative Lytic polysaccharide monooxygenase 9 [Phytophthora infestans]